MKATRLSSALTTLAGIQRVDSRQYSLRIHFAVFPCRDVILVCFIQAVYEWSRSAVLTWTIFRVCAVFHYVSK